MFASFSVVHSLLFFLLHCSACWLARSLTRMHTSPHIQGYEYQDPGYRTYVGFLMLDYHYSNPVAMAFAGLLTETVKNEKIFLCAMRKRSEAHAAGVFASAFDSSSASDSALLDENNVETGKREKREKREQGE